MLRTLSCLALVLVGTVGLAACEPRHRTGTGTKTSGDVVIATGMSREGSVETHFVECAADPNAELGDYQVVVSAEVGYGIPEGAPCPAGPREPMAHQENPELYAELSRAVSEPLPYGGGDIHSDCGAWETDDKANARELAVECPPLKWGDLR
ncbi:hypothetical protein [Saccharopolyspora sp. ASAGF58]|uniref:hypothetical protein n=1 Tax=Saccharopolyspora sp. ASAGF58 TaxID=2719023 RepID=UPI00143FE578|nr:hypothetical protein [Saccharopolyspora sp. ASAGF58]QIZ36123.1 hypothetical protein FDZ84_17370 [Saccharopolyspora sp. ASAGF58]